MFDNLFTDQYRFDYSEPSDNDDGEILDLNVILNVDDETTSHAPKFRDASGSTFVVSHD
jgi:hypothetical protein